MKRIFAAVLIAAVGASTPAVADEVLLRSGAKFTGVIEQDDEEMVVIRTPDGRLRFARSLVASTRKDEAESEAPAADAAPRFVPREIARIEGIASGVAPATTPAFAVLARKSGGVAAIAADGSEKWASPAGGVVVSGVTADTGAVYLATTKGDVIRLSAQTGEPAWTSATGQALSGAPLLHQRGVFAFSPGAGLVGVESATGAIRGMLGMETVLDAPLAAAGRTILVGDGEGRLALVVGDGTAIGGVLETHRAFGDLPLPIAGRFVALDLDGSLATIDAEAGTILRRHPTPGLSGHPLAADLSRAYVLLSGVLAGVDQATGRVLWQCRAVGRATSASASGDVLLVTSADGKLHAVSATDGRIRWSADLGAPAAGPPVRIGSAILVVTMEGEAILFTEGVAGPGDAPAAPPPPRAAQGRTLLSPEGYRITAPTSWTTSETVTRGLVSMGLAPIPDAPRFLLTTATEADRHRLSLTGRITIVVLPAEGIEPEERLKQILAGERAGATANGQTLSDLSESDERIGERTFAAAEYALTGPGAARTEATIFVGPFHDDRHVVIAARAPPAFAELVMADFREVAASFEPSPADVSPPPEVLAAEKAIAAIMAGDRAALLPMLSAPVKRRLGDGAVRAPGRLSIPVRDSRRAGAFRQVRVRIDTGEGTVYTGLDLVEEGGRWIVADDGGLL